MKKVLAVFTAVALLSVAVSAFAQAPTPNVTVYFDDQYNNTQANCPSDPLGTVFGNLYVVANNFNQFINAIEYKIIYPPELAFLGDNPTSPLVIGNSPAGISIAWALPQNGFGPVLCQTPAILWLCQNCASTDIPVVVVPNPLNIDGKVQGTSWPNNNKIDAVGMTSLICATVPAEDTTWGGIKALYGE